ncbi:MAG: hypothetical protein C0424_05920 [Sphingobacteriaceae bacterium]|nr:hypothetical protein [Sphingobacteriaceae bacterium]
MGSSNGGIQKVQLIYTPADLSGSRNAPHLTSIYLRALGVISTPLVVNNLQIRMGHLAQQNFNNNQFFDSLQTVVVALPSRTFTASQLVGNYLRIDLDHFFTFDSSRTLVVEVSATQSNAVFLGAATARNGRRMVANSTTATQGTIDNQQWNIGFDLANLRPFDAQLASIMQPAVNLIAEGKHAVQMRLRNNSTDSLHQLHLRYRWRGQTVQATWTGLVLPGHFFNYQFLDSISTGKFRSDTLWVWCDVAQGGIDPDTTNNRLSTVLTTHTGGGVYSVGRPTSDFTTLNAAWSYLNAQGLQGPVTLELESGIYNTQFQLSAINGSNASRLITIRSKAVNADSVVILGPSSPALTLNGAVHLLFTDLTFRRTGNFPTSTLGLLRINNAGFITFSRCKLQVTGLSASGTSDGQHNVIVNQSNNLRFTNCEVLGGRYSFEFNSAQNLQPNISIDSCRIIEPSTAIYFAERISNFVFNRNVVVKTTTQPNANAQLEHVLGSAFTITNNTLQITSSGPTFKLTDINRGTQAANLISNNIMNIRLTNVFGFMNTNVTNINGALNFLMDHNNIRIQSLFNAFHVEGQFLLPLAPVFNDGIRVTNNAFIWSTVDTNDVFVVMDSSITPNRILFNNNVYHLPSPNRFMFATGFAQPRRAFGSFPGWDASSFYLPIQLDSIQGFRVLPSSSVSRLSNTSALTLLDFTGKTRSRPASDIGAYQEDTIYRPLLLHNPISDTAWLGSRTLTARALLAQPSDTLFVQLFYKRAHDVSWVSVNAQRIANNQYRAQLDLSLFPTNTFGPVVIQYFFRYSIPGQAQITLPAGGTATTAPNTTFSYNTGAALAGNYRLGQNGEIPNLTALSNIMSGANINADVKILLTDTFYNLTGNWVLGNYKLLQPGLRVEFRPDVNKNVTIRVPFNTLSWMQSTITLTNVQNFTWSGKDTLGGGSLTLNTTAQQMSFLELINGINRPNRVIFEHTTVKSLHPTSAAYKGIEFRTAFSGPADSTEIFIRNNRFSGCNRAISGGMNRKVVIENNIIGDSTDNTLKQFYAVELSGYDSVIFENNVIEQYWSDPQFFSYLVRFNASQVHTRVTNNVFRNIGFRNHPLLASNAPRVHQIILFSTSSGRITFMGNLITQLQYPSGRTGTTLPYELQLISTDAVSNDYLNNLDIDFVNNTIQLGNIPAGNLRHRPTIFHFSTSPKFRLINNLIAVDLAHADTNRLQGVLFRTDGSKALLLKRMRLENNVFVRPQLAAIPYFRQGTLTADSTLEVFESRLVSSSDTIPLPNREINGNLALLMPQVSLPAPAVRTFAKANGKPVQFLGAAVNDLNGQVRQVSGQLLPDIGAYVLPSGQSSEITRPLLGMAQFDTLLYACSGTSRNFSVTASDFGSGIRSVQLMLFNQNQTTFQSLNLISGNRTSGRWAGTLPSDTFDRKFEARLMAIDSAGNVGWSSASQNYTNFVLNPEVVAPQVITARDTLVARAKTLAAYPLVISEVTLNQFLPHGTPNLPGYLLPTGNKFVEITNHGTDTVDLTGCTFRPNLWFNNIFTFPAGHRLPPGVSMVLSKMGGSSRPEFHYFNMNLPDMLPGTFFGDAVFTLESPDGQIIDRIVFHEYDEHRLGEVENWVGDGIYVGPNNTIGGFQLIGKDVNGNKHWAVYSATRPGSLGRYNQGLPRRKSADFVWSGLVHGTGMRIQAGPFFGGSNGPLQLSTSLDNCSSSASNTLGISGNDSTDIIPPKLQILQLSPNFFDAKCHGNGRSLNVTATDSNNGSGVNQVWLVMHAPRSVHRWLMPRINGNSTSGFYSIDLSHELRSGSLSIVAIDVAQNNSDTLHIGYFEGNRNRVTAMNDTAINLGTSLNLRAVARNTHRQAIQISEVVISASASMQGSSSLPAGLNLTANDEVIEVSNMSDDSVFVGGILLMIYQQNASLLHRYALPEYVMAPRSQIYLVGSSLPQSGNNVFRLPFPTNFLLPATPYSLALADTLFTNFTFLSGLVLNNAMYGFPSTMFSGAGISTTSTSVGVQRISTSSTAAGWQVTNGTSLPTTLGSAFQLPQTLPVISWFGPAGFLGNGNNLQVNPTQNSLYVAAVGSGTCLVRDTVLVRLNGSAFQNDAALMRFVFPNPMSIANAAVAVSVWVRNAGNVPLTSIPMELWVNNQRLTTEHLGNYLAVGDSAILTFQTPWLPPRGGLHNLQVKSNVIGDSRTANDTLSISAYGLEAPNFVRIIDILNPVNATSIADSSLVRVRVTNTGTNVINNLRLLYFDNAGTSYKQDFNLSLPIGASEILSFNKQYAPINTGSNNLCVRSEVQYADQKCVQLWATSSPDLPAGMGSIVLYPNPASHTLNLRISEGVIPISCRIVDMTGRQIKTFEQTGQGAHQHLDVQELADGMYLLLIQTTEGMHFKRFVIQD